MTIHANRLILGFAKIASYFRTLVVTAGQEQSHCDLWGGGGGLPPRLSPASGSGNASY